MTAHDMEIGDVIEAGIVPCRQCGRPHDRRVTEVATRLQGAMTSWAADDGHTYVKMTAEEVILDAARSQPEAGLTYDRWIDSLHEDANGLVWTTKAELRAALAAPAAGPTEPCPTCWQPVPVPQRGDHDYGIPLAADMKRPDHNHPHDSLCLVSECPRGAWDAARSQPETGLLREAVIGLLTTNHGPWLNSDGVTRCECVYHEGARAALDATPAARLDADHHTDGEPHRYEVRCTVCGEAGTVRLSIEPQVFAPPGLRPCAHPFDRLYRPDHRVICDACGYTDPRLDARLAEEPT